MKTPSLRLFCLAAFICAAQSLNANLLPNGGFESGTAGWSFFGGETATLVTDDPQEGSNALRIGNRTADFNGAYYDLKPLLQDGQTYIISAWMRVDPADAPDLLRLRVNVNDSSASVQRIVVASVFTFDGLWRKVEGEFTLNVNGTLNSLFLQALGPAGGKDLYLDNVRIVEKPAAPAAPADVGVVVDFATPLDRPSLAGQLYGLRDSSPPDNLIAPLEPAYWRGSNRAQFSNMRGRVEANGATFIELLSEYWGYPVSGTPTPWSDWTAYEANVRARAQAMGTGVVYDIWNEPDAGIFFTDWADGTFANYLETFRRAHNVIRDEHGAAAVICGPSFATPDYDQIKAFLDYCVANSLTVQVLSIHLLGSFDNELPQVRALLDRLQNDFVDHPDYDAIGLDELHVNEYLMTNAEAPSQNIRPGSILAYLYHMESAGVDAAMRACWPHPDTGNDSCFDGSLAAMLTPDTGETRPVWHAYRFYGAGAGSRVAATTSDLDIVPLASSASDQPNQAQVVLGYSAESLPHGTRDVTVSLDNLTSLPFIDSGTPALSVTVERILVSGDATAALLATTDSDDFVPISSGSAQITVTDLSLYEAVRITLEKATTLSISSVTGGDAAADPAQTFYRPEDQVTITASPDPSYLFDLWSGAPSGQATENPLLLTMSEDYSLTPAFGNDTRTYPGWSREETGGTVLSETGDGDLDGRANLIEYAFGLDPEVNDSQVPLLQIAPAPGGVEVFYEHPGDRNDLDIRLRSTSDLSDHFADYPGTVTDTPQPGGGLRSSLTDSGSENFFRLRVELQ